MAHIRDLLSVTSGQAIPLCFRDGAAIGGFRLPHLGPDEAATHGCRSTVDILLAHSHRWLLSYRLWQHYKEQDFWLVPTQGEGRSFRIWHGLLALSPRAPFFCPYERNYGFELAAESLDARRGGY